MKESLLNPSLIADRFAQAIINRPEEPVDENTHIFEEVPVALEEFLYSKEYLALPRLSQIQLDLVAHVTDIYPNELQELLDWPTREFNTEVVVALWGKGSGKDFCIRVSLLRVVYLLLCLRNPHEVYGMDSASSIDVINMAYSARQARRIFFEPLRVQLNQCSWFLGKFRALQTEIMFDKNVRAMSGNSDQEAFEGFNPILVCLDEIDAFKTSEDLRRHGGLRPEHSAQGIFANLRSSMKSRFPATGKVALLSWPRRPDGFIFQQYNLSQENEMMYGSFGATWEVNPQRTREDFDSDFRDDPDDASMRYACVPTITGAHYFQNRDHLAQIFHYNPTTGHLLPDAPANHFDGIDFATEKLLPQSDARPRFMHVDLGETNDSAAFVSVYLYGYVQRYNIQMPVVALDFIGTIDPLKVGRVEFEWVRSLILRFRTMRENALTNIQMVTFDSWQSADSIQILSRNGIRVGRQSVDRDTRAYDLMKELINDSRLLSPGSELLYQECAALVRTGNGKVDHPPGGSKDTTDALAGAVQNLYDFYFGADPTKPETVEIQTFSDIPEIGSY